MHIPADSPTAESRGTDVTVMVLTRQRPHLLRGALRCLAAQNGIMLDVLVMIDDCPASVDVLDRHAWQVGAISSLRWVYVRRRDGECSGPARVANLRAMALSLARSPWLSYLDDDNALEPDHFATLLKCVIDHRAQAAHSWRTMWTRSGKPFPLRGRHPWCRNAEVAKAMFKQYEAAGIYVYGSSTIRDQVVPYRRDRSMVDTSEWLYRRSFLLQLEFCNSYSREDWELGRSEDNKLLDGIVAAGIAIPSTKRATLRYHLGGYSNNPLDEAATLPGWLSNAPPLDAKRDITTSGSWPP
jgi:hypothetical protein